MKTLFRNISVGESKKLVKPILWMCLSNIVNLLPFLVLAVIVRVLVLWYTGIEIEQRLVWLLWGTMAVLMFVSYFIQKKSQRVTYVEAYAVSANARVRLAERIRKLPLGYLTSKDPGELGNMMMVDFEQTERAMTHSLPQLVSSVLVSVIAFVPMLFIDWRMALAMFAGLPVAALILWIASGLERKVQEHLLQARLSQSNRLQEYLSGMKEIKAYNLQGENFDAFRDACVGYRDTCIKNEGIIGPISLSATALLKAGLPLMTIIGAHLLLGGSLDVSTFAFFLLVGTRVFDPLTTAIMRLSELKACNLSGERVMAVLAQPVMNGENHIPKHHNLSFEGVTFGYNNETVLENVTISINEGEMTAIVGPSGSGKSTALRLAARFYDPQTGRVCFGGVDEQAIDPETLMSQISMVFQDVYLFKDTVYNNIRYGKEIASRKEIEAAAKAARCFDFIMKLPQGFDTMIGEGGSTLSGGEKQRISIARAILKNAPVILLDEATSSLDPENEAEIQEAINGLVEGRTVIMIAHRLKTIRNADKIIVLERGQVTEQGKHEELLQKGGLYAHLWELQSQMGGWKIG